MSPTEPHIPAFSSYAPNTSRPTFASTIAPAHWAHGSSVTYRVQSVRRSVARARSACWIASSSAWAVGSRRETDSLWARATTTPSRNTAAPTGTSPADAARRASSSAAAMPARSAADGLGTHRLGGRRRDALERQVGPVHGPLQRPRPVHRVVPVGDDQLLRGRRHVQAELAISHELREPRNLQVHDLPD